MVENAHICDVAINTIPHDWRAFMESHDDLYNRAIAILHNLEKDARGKGQLLQSQICPPPERIFAFMDCPLNNIKIILIGQDPYSGIDKITGLKEAEGHAFSVPNGARIPPSLRNIYKCLVAHKLMDERDSTISGNLTRWAQQGILLVNAALTTILSTSGSHLTHWKTFTRDLLISIGREYGNIIYILLGKSAQELIPIISKNCSYLKWSHPSPLCVANRNESNPQHFMKCTVFAVANNMLCANGRTPIDWNPNSQPPTNVVANAPALAPTPSHELFKNLTTEEITREHVLFSPFVNKIVVFVDGAASCNGQADCCASYAAVIICANTLYSLCGMVEPYYDITGTIVRPTNNRAELMAFREAFAFLCSDECAARSATSDGLQWPVLVVYDSAYACGCIREWYANWCKKPPKEIKANIDIIKTAYEYKERVASLRQIEWHRVKSHVPTPRDKIEQYYWHGNNYVDKIAQSLTQK
jgi:uracil-DNA glycosylase